MADKKISALTGATTPLAGTEVLPIVQSGATVKVAVSDLTAGRVVSATQLTSTIAIGTAPLVVTSTTNVANLNASSLNGATFAAPGAIGGGTAAAGAFTTVTASGLVTSNAATTGSFSAYSTATGGYWMNQTSNTVSTKRMTNNANDDTVIFPGASGKRITFNNFANSAENIVIDDNGIITMGAYGAGAATFSAAGVISSVSDETWKTKDGIPTDPDTMLKKLQPGYWFYNAEKAPIYGAERQLGFYAQNVNAAIGPEAAPKPEEGKPWGYYDRSILAVTVMSLQKALATIESLNARISVLETKCP